MGKWAFFDITAKWPLGIFCWYLILLIGGVCMLQDRQGMLQRRLEAKDLDHQFRAEIEHGMGCNRFVSEAIVQTVHDVYLPLLDSERNLKPGQMYFQCLSQRNGSRAHVAEAELVTVTLTVDGGVQDQQVRTRQGVEGVRRTRICRVCQEAYAQGGVLTVEDLAYRLLNVGERTVVRDLAHLRHAGQNPPLRSTVKDIGRTLSHKTLIVKNWLLGDERSDLERKYHHSLSSIENYLDTFKRVVALEAQGYTVQRSAYLLKISRGLAEGYLNIWKTYRAQALPFRIREVEDALQASRCEGKKTNREAS